jgi:spore coat protein U-like protein
MHAKLTPMRGSIAATMMASALLAPSSGAAQSCAASASAVSFGVYDPRSAAPTLTTGTLVFRCTGRVPITIRLHSASDRQGQGRHLTGRNSRLQYDLYLDAATTIPWGDGQRGTQYYSNSSPTANSNTTVTIYGKIPPGQTQAAAGIYQDTITIAIDF